MKHELWKTDILAILDIFDEKINDIYQNQWNFPTFYLMWGSTILIDSTYNFSYERTKDLDFLWHHNKILDQIFMDTINNRKYQCIPHENRDFEEWDLFIWFDLYPEKYQMEFLSTKLIIDKNNKNSDIDLIDDINKFYLNNEYNGRYKHIKLCNSFIPWYSRLVMARYESEQFHVWCDNLLDDWHVLKTIKNINDNIKYWLLTKELVYNNIWYLVEKYHWNNKLVMEDFDLFMSKIED